MNNEKQDAPEPKQGLIDRRFFLKKTSTAVAVVAAGSLIATSAAENQLPAENNTENIPASTGDNNPTNKQWKAGWMAF
jgi:hypothetical protein